MLDHVRALDYTRLMIGTPPATLAIEPAAFAAACARLELSMVVLFGAHASGLPAPGADSDVDLALRPQPGRRRPRLWDYYDALRDCFEGASLDVVMLADADPLFRWEIMRQGTLLWGDALEYLEYRAFAFRDFVDSADLRALEGRLFERKMALLHERLRAAS